MASIYMTVQGDTWDVISLKNYGSELFTDRLVSANLNQKDVDIFGAGVKIKVPEVSTDQIQQTNLPPWRR